MSVRLHDLSGAVLPSVSFVKAFAKGSEQGFYFWAEVVEMGTLSLNARGVRIAVPRWADNQAAPTLVGMRSEPISLPFSDFAVFAYTIPAPSWW